MQINLFRCTAERNRVNKEGFITDRFTLNGTIKKATSTTNLIVEIEKSEIIPYKYNYMYIEKFGRYYFIDDIISVANNRWEIRASCDVLFSFITDIYNMTAIIDKVENQNDANLYLDDGSFVMDTRLYNTVIEFDNGFNDDGEFILICAGGL